jgi:acetylglutamate kinase
MEQKVQHAADLFERASHLIEALPYVRQFYGKTVVIKCGGSAMTESDEMRNMMQDVALLYFCGIRPVIIHGGGSEISDLCQRLNIDVKFHEGQRVTDEHTLDIVQMVLSGKVNKSLVMQLNQTGVKAVGLSGQDAKFLQVETFSPDSPLGYVGKITHIDTELMQTLLTAGFIPVIAPLGVDAQGQTYNINGDFAASAIASSLRAEKLMILSDVDGLYAERNDPSSKLSVLTTEAANNLLVENKISGGMIPKLQACNEAVEQGVSTAHIINGKKRHSLLLEILTNHGIGTMITKGD